ncbi:MAG TPA: hypothetical protein VNM37_07255, partial [Candidatus Dormibacteraeota bacterium]|nr:hypothetical protein [Candidatus Dormibacteraeota bacterium]
MSDPVVSPSVNPGRPKPRRWLRRLGIGAGSVLVLFVAAYFVLTSGAFFKGVILPKVGQAIHATITVSDASISPFSHVILRDLKVQTTGTEPLVTAQEVRAQYSLWAILGGNLKVTEVTLNSPTVTVIKNPHGSSNLDPLKGSADSGASQKKTPAAGSSSPGGASPTGGSGGSGGSGSSRSAKPLQVDLSKVALNNAT